MDVSSNTVDFGRATINGKNFVWEDLNTITGDREDNGTGTLTLNPPICNTYLKGLAKVDGTEEYGLFSGDDGFYISVDTNRSSADDFIFGIGSSKPLQ